MFIAFSFLLSAELQIGNYDDTYIASQLQRLSAAESQCVKPEAYGSLFSLPLREFNAADTEWLLSEFIDAAFLACPKKFMLALKREKKDSQLAVIKLFGKYGEPTKLAEALWAIQKDQDVGQYVSEHFADFGVLRDGSR